MSGGENIYVRLNYVGDQAKNDEFSGSESDGEDQPREEDTSLGARSGAKGWNARFQKYLLLQDLAEKWQKIARLSRDFIEVSSTYGKIIISEIHLPEKDKTIKSLSGYGLAGGTKFLIQDIFFKFAFDTCITGTNKWLYGVYARNDERAMKSATGEMKGASCLMKCGFGESLKMPFMTLIHFRGYCLIAMSIVPIDKTTIVYGSRDGGKTVHCEPVASDLMKSIANLLNLSSHKVNGVDIYGPGDIEIHKGMDGNHYVIDFGRLFPPEAPSNSSPSSSIFYSFLRPTMVKRSPVPLCSDGFSGWCNSDPHVQQINLDLRNATDLIYTQLIPEFSKYLLETHIQDKLNYDQEKEWKILISELHRKGINLRHLGHVRSEIPTSFTRIRKLLLTECVARTIKNELNALLREKMLIKRKATVEPFLDEAFQFLTPILQFKEHLPSKFVHSKAQKSKFWTFKHKKISVIKSPSENNLLTFSNYPIPQSFSYFYFEIHIIEMGHIKFGLSIEKNTESTHCFRYDVTEGAIQDPDNTTETLKCKPSDSVGLFYSSLNNTIIFTVNKEMIGYVSKKVPRQKELYPFIWISSNSQATLTFHLKPPFHFPLHILTAKETNGNDNISKTHSQYWCADIKTQVKSRFDNVFNEEEMDANFDLRKHLSFSFLISRLSEFSGLVFSQRILDYTEGKKLELRRNDLLGFKLRVSHLGVVELAEALSTLFNFQKLDRKEKEDPQNTQQLEKVATEITSSLQAAPIRLMIELFYCASIWFELYQYKTEMKQLYLDKATDMILNAEEVNNEPLTHNVLYLQGKIYCELAFLNSTESESLFNKASEKFKALFITNTAKSAVLIEKYLEELKTSISFSKYSLESRRLLKQSQLIWEAAAGDFQNISANLQLFTIIWKSCTHDEVISENNISLSKKLIQKMDKDVLIKYLIENTLYPVQGTCLATILSVFLSNENFSTILAEYLEQQKTIKVISYTYPLKSLVENLLQKSSLPDIVTNFLKDLQQYSYEGNMRYKTNFVSLYVPGSLTDATLDETATALALAHYDNPYSVFYAGSKKRLKKLQWFYKATLKYCQRYGRHRIVTNSSNAVVGAIMWQHPYENDATLSRMVEVGLAGMANIFGFKRSLNFGSLFNSSQQKRKAIMKDEPHFYLFSIGVIPEFQHKGYGSSLMHPFIAEIDHDDLKCYIDCPVETSVPFFKKWGFEIIEETLIGSSTKSYLMVRKQKSSLA
eukprot:TRINITY_DN12232_c0_g1_i1.p1 TRINITY_DN12232_c0_g1~~TRINITY_DN12232_c0_g1_i1.p1  ORF type:complete len:1242 (-),score=329.75 TRINITY_DN12232_c0_g1_i1:18-3698(-)